MRSPNILFVVPLLVPAAYCQSVVSVHSGLINHSEGAVFIDNQPVSKSPGRFVTLKKGSTLLTRDGRAEILLSPDAYLRLGVDSSVRMVSDTLSDTQLELLSGSAILDSGNSAGQPVTLLVNDARVRVEDPSRLRVDAQPPQLRVEKGKAHVERNGNDFVVNADQRLPLAGSSIVQRMTEGSDDMLDLWSLQRNRLIYLNLASAQRIADPADNTGADVNAFLGMPADAGIWTGLLPPPTTLPAAGVYFTPWSTFGYGYAAGPYSFYSNRAIHGFLPGYGYGYGSGLGYIRRPYPGVAYPGVSPGYRPVNPGFRTGPTRPVGSVPQPVPGTGMPRPVAPHIPGHR